MRRRRRLSLFGCWQEAGGRLEDALGEDADSPPVWHWIGLLRAWDGDDVGASEALHRAASQYTEFGVAVECETLAQLLDQYGPEQTCNMRAQRFDVRSVGQLLTKLDEVGRCVRLPAPESAADEASVARYLLLDRESNTDPAALTRQETPRHIAQIAVFDSPDSADVPAQLLVSALEGGPLESAVELLTEAAGDLLGSDEVADSDEPVSAVSGMVPREQVDLLQNYYFPPRTQGKIRTAIQKEEWDEVVSGALGRTWPWRVWKVGRPRKLRETSRCAFGWPRPLLYSTPTAPCDRSFSPSRISVSDWGFRRRRRAKSARQRI